MGVGETIKLILSILLKQCYLLCTHILIGLKNSVFINK